MSGVREDYMLLFSGLDGVLMSACSFQTDKPCCGGELLF